jgi:GntR family transcriptional regulator, phosphonate transport system regulatory protein
MTNTLTSTASLQALPTERVSFWLRIANELSEAIARGVYEPGQRLPSEHVLAEQFGVNRHTIRRSLASLCQKGLVRITQGSGTYVEDFAVDLILGKRTRHRQSLAQAGLRGGLEVQDAQRTRATAAQAQALQLPARSTVLHLQVLGVGAGQPLHVSDRVFPLPRFEGLEAVLRETGSITDAFAAHGVTDYTRKESRITAQLPSPEIAALLRQPVNRPVLFVTSVNIDSAGVPIEFASTWFAGDRVKLTVTHDER